MTLAEIARRIEAIRPGTLPRLLSVGTESLWTNCADSPEFVARLPDDIARHMLIGAMVMATKASRAFTEADDDSEDEFIYGWSVGSFTIWDSDHGKDELRSLLAAFEAVYAKEAK